MCNTPRMAVLQTCIAAILATHKKNPPGRCCLSNTKKKKKIIIMVRIKVKKIIICHKIIICYSNENFTPTLLFLREMRDSNWRKPLHDIPGISFFMDENNSRTCISNSCIPRIPVQQSHSILARKKNSNRHVLCYNLPQLTKHFILVSINVKIGMQITIMNTASWWPEIVCNEIHHTEALCSVAVIAAKTRQVHIKPSCINSIYSNSYPWKNEKWRNW